MPTAEALAVFDVLKEKLGITPMEEPFTYLRRLQDSYNYGVLNFSNEFYEIFNVHPVTGTEHLLTVQEFEMQEMDENRFHDNELEFPRHLAAMTYTIIPELARDAFMLKDCNSGDSPRPKNPAERGRYAMSIGAIAVIRSTDGLTQVYYVGGEAVKPHVICSSLHFEPIQEPIEWRLIFREKMMEDVDVELI